MAAPEPIAHRGIFDNPKPPNPAGPNRPAQQMETTMNHTLKTSAIALMIFAGASFATTAAMAGTGAAKTETAVAAHGKAHSKLWQKLFGSSSTATTGTDVSGSADGSGMSGTDFEGDSATETEVDSSANAADDTETESETESD